MSHPLISVIIRTKNEEKYLAQVLEKLKQQTFQDFETIIVDDNSTDRTLEIARNFGCKIVSMQKGTFTYPHACNVGIENSAGKYIIFMSGHSVPMYDGWIKSGLNDFQDDRVAGVYGVPFALPNANWLERLTYNFWSGIVRARRRVINREKDVNMGVLGFTNAMIRRDLWSQYHINEAFAAGGEDGDWGRHWVARGFVLIHDPKFKVYHSHDLGAIDLIRQLLGWRRMHKENEFKPQKKNV